MSVADLAARDLFWRIRRDPRRADVELSRRAEVFPYFVPISAALGREAVVDGRTCLMFGSNNYLGLADDARVVGAAEDALRRYGTGCTGSRLMNGTLELHLELETLLARWMRRDAAIVFSAGYLANLATLATICDPSSVIVGDARNHASIEDGARLSGARIVSVRHNDLAQLGAKLARVDAPTLVVWDSVFSMEGDGVDVDALVDLARDAGARVLLDEAHSLGVLGPDGAGIAAGMDRPPDLVMGTFSKSLASSGGVVAGDGDVIEYLRLHARPFVFTASAVPAAVAAAAAAVRVAIDEPWRAARARATASALATGLADAGFAVHGGAAAIVSVEMPDEWAATLAWRALLDAGVYVNVGLFPAVPRGEALLRLSTTAQHTDADVAACIDAFTRVVRP